MPPKRVGYLSPGPSPTNTSRLDRDAALAQRNMSAFARPSSSHALRGQTENAMRLPPMERHAIARPNEVTPSASLIGDASFVFDDLLLQSEHAIKRNQLKALDQLHALKRVLNHADTLVADLDAGSNSVGEGGDDKAQAVSDIISAMMHRRGAYADSLAKAEGVLSLGPALKASSDEERVKECFFALARSIPSGTVELDLLAKELLSASPSEGVETIYKYLFKSLADTYDNAQALTTEFGQAADLTPEGDSEKSIANSTNTKRMRRLVGQLRKALATMALCSNAGLDLCTDLRNRSEVNEASLRNVSKNSVLLARHARQLQIENESLRAQVFATGATKEEQEVNAINITERIGSKSEAPRTIVMMQIESTQTLKLMKPTVVSEALLQVHQWIDIKLPQFKGRRVNYNSAAEPRDVFDSSTNPMFAPESYVMEFASIGPAIEFCVNMQHELLYTVDWSPRLLRLKDFKEVKDSIQVAPPGETPSQRKRRIAAQLPLWRGLRMRMAINVGVPHMVRPFKKEVLEEANRRYSIAVGQRGPETGDRPDDSGTGESLRPENTPHLTGAAMDLTMLVLRRSRGGEILLSPKANEAFDDLKFMYPEALSNVRKVERDYSSLKGPNTTASDAWLGEGEIKEPEKPPAETPQRRTTLAEEAAFLRPSDRLFAIVSDVIKNRERPRQPFSYHNTFEVVFPPTAFWRMTDAAQQNLSLYANAASRVEVLEDEEDDEEFSDESDDDSYIPAEKIAAPTLLQIEAPSRRKSSTESGQAPSPLDALRLGAADSTGGAKGDDLLAALLAGTGVGSASPQGGPQAATKGKRRTAAEYEELLALCTGRIDGLTRRLNQLEEMNSLYSNEVQSTREQNNRLADKTKVAERAAKVQQRAKDIYKSQCARLSNTLMAAADRMHATSTEVVALKAETVELAATLKKAQTHAQGLQGEIEAREQRRDTDRSVGTMTGSDPALVEATSKVTALEAALRGLGSIAGAWVLHIEAIGKAPTKDGPAQKTNPSAITGDLHSKMNSLLHDGPAAALSPSSAAKSQPAAAPAKGTRWDELLRVAKNALSLVKEDDPASSCLAKDTTSYDCLRVLCGLLARGMKGVIDFENLMSVKNSKLTSALHNAHHAIDASMGGPLTDRSSYAMSTDDGYDPEKSLDSTTIHSSEGQANFINPLHLKRIRDAERKVQEQNDMIAQYKTDALKSSADSLIGEQEVEVAALRLVAMTGKATEMATALRNIRETLGAVLEKLHTEAGNAALIKMRILKEKGEAKPIAREDGTVVDAMEGSVMSTESVSPRTPSLASPTLGNEYLISKIFGDLQHALSTTIVDFCSSGAVAPPKAAAAPEGAKKSLFYGDGGFVANLNPMGKAKALQTGNGMLQHEVEIQTILYKSTVDTSIGNPTVGPTQVALDRLKEDAERVTKMMAPLDARAKIYAEKESQRKARDSEFESMTWAPVLEKSFARERYLSDQVKYLKKRNEVSESDRQASKDRVSTIFTQTGLTMDHRLFQKLDEAERAGVDIEQVERDRVRSEADAAVAKLLSTWHNSPEQSTQTTIIEVEKHWTQTDARVTGLPPPEPTPDQIVPAPATMLVKPLAVLPTIEKTSVGTMTAIERTSLPMISLVTRSVATMTDEDLTIHDHSIEGQERRERMALRQIPPQAAAPPSSLRQFKSQRQVPPASDISLPADQLTSRKSSNADSLVVAQMTASLTSVASTTTTPMIAPSITAEVSAELHAEDSGVVPPNVPNLVTESGISAEGKPASETDRATIGNRSAVNASSELPAAATAPLAASKKILPSTGKGSASSTPGLKAAVKAERQKETTESNIKARQPKSDIKVTETQNPPRAVPRSQAPPVLFSTASQLPRLDKGALGSNKSDAAPSVKETQKTAVVGVKSQVASAKSLDEPAAANKVNDVLTLSDAKATDEEEEVLLSTIGGMGEAVLVSHTPAADGLLSVDKQLDRPRSGLSNRASDSTNLSMNARKEFIQGFLDLSSAVMTPQEETFHLPNPSPKGTESVNRPPKVISKVLDTSRLQQSAKRPATVPDRLKRKPQAEPPAYLKPPTKTVEDGQADGDLPHQEGAEVSTPQPHQKVPTSISELVARARGGGGYSPTTQSVITQRQSGIPYALAPPAEISTQYDVHRRYLERQSIFGEAAVDYDRLLLRPVATLAATTEVAREVHALREAKRMSDADQLRVDIARGRVVDKLSASHRSALSPLSAAPSSAAIQQVLSRPLTTSAIPRTVLSSHSILNSASLVGGHTLRPVLDFSGDPLIRSDEHGRPTSPVDTPKASCLDKGDKVRFLSSRHTRLAPSAHSLLPPKPGTAPGNLSGVGSQSVIVRNDDQGLLQARAHTPLSKRSTSQQRSPMLAIQAVRK